MAFKAYIKEIADAVKAGNATEHTHRPALKNLIESLGVGIVATNEPKRIKCGAPDFIVSHRQTPLGYVEAKDVGADLDDVEEDKQLLRYRASLRNLVLTDYLEFRLYRNGELAQTAKLASLRKNGLLKPHEGGIEAVEVLLKAFLQANLPSVSSSRELAKRMALLAQLIRDLIRQTFAQEGDQGELHSQYEAFRRVLLAELEPQQFADMYAQTLCYGLFAARCNHEGVGFTRDHAAAELPKTNPFLRKLFAQIAGVDLDERIAWAVDDLANLLAYADMPKILEDFGKATRQEDPVVHFYETFLTAYDPKERERRGVYYTPEPVVRYIVHSVDAVLKKEFGLPRGLADNSKVRLKRAVKRRKDGGVQRKKDGGELYEAFETHKVQILDPATGTGTFLYFVIGLIREALKPNAGLWQSYVAEHLLPRIFGFELLMAPYAVAHMKLGLELRESGYDFASDERLRVFLTNTLEEAHELTGLPLFTQWLSQEAASASEIKQNAPIMVVLGNPPYSGHSANTGEWINGLLRGVDSVSKEPTGSYFSVNGEPLGERNSKWLNDDYVKFLRFAQWRIDRTGHGVLAFITNHGYLDNPTFRGMRQSLLKSFDKCYLLDLHGSTKKKEQSPSGEKDENVFDIQQGVAIGIFIKHGGGASDADAEVNYAELWGSREEKYEWLDERDVFKTKWIALKPKSPTYLFVPRDEELFSEYETAWKVTDIMPLNTVGIITKRDGLTIQFTPQEMWETVVQFADLPEAAAREKFDLPEDVRDWKVAWAQKDLKSAGLSKNKIVQIHYRPFDFRYTYYTGNSRGFIGWPFEKTMKHMMGHNNIGLISARSNKSSEPDHFFCSRFITETKCGEATTQSQFFPLFTYGSSDENEDLFAETRSANLSPAFLQLVEKTLNLRYVAKGGDLEKTFGPEQVFHYIYAVFFAREYRKRYALFLKTDFPRVPLTKDVKVFRKLSELGRKLVQIHLMEDQIKTSVRYPVAGNNKVEKVEFVDGRVFINATQYFEGISAAVWAYHIGGYRVASKWLKDRKGRYLTHDDCSHYMQVVAALASTGGLQDRIDESIPNWPMH